MKRLWVTILTVLTIWSVPAAVVAAELTVFTAASTADALRKAADTFESQNGIQITIAPAASSTLARQIDAGAPADIFVSANADWMDWLQQRQRIVPGSRVVIAANRLVAAGLDPLPGEDGPELLSQARRFVMGDPSHVPAGQYAKAVLVKLGIWSSVAGKAIFAENVRVALEYVRRGEVPVGIVYASDLLVAPELKVLWDMPVDDHPPIVVPAARVHNAHPQAQAFLDYLMSTEGQDAFAAFGFKVIDHGVDD